jgi:hypothetical protein
MTVANAVSSYTIPMMSDRGVTSLISAAVVSTKFRTLLLTDPANAMDSGYCGQSFSLKPEEKEKILSIHATSLTDFARQLTNYSMTHD